MRLLKNDVQYDNYFLLTFYEFNNEFIDLPNPTLYYQKYPAAENEPVFLKLQSLEE